MKNRKIVFWIGCIVFGLVLLFIAYMQNRLTNHGILLNAHTLEWAGSSHMGMNLKYEFYYNGGKKTGDNGFEKIRGNTDFENKYFPVMYDTVLGASQLLIEPSDFERFNIPFPDSLNWVLPYLK